MYSYSYDLTHSLQFNMAPCNLPTEMSATDNDQLVSSSEFWQTDVGSDEVVHDSCCSERDVEDASSVLQADLFTGDTTSSTSRTVAAVDNSDQIGSKCGSNSGLQDLPASTEGSMFLPLVL